MDLTALSARQHGLVTRAQALASGLTPAQVRWRLQARQWQRVHPGVYAVHTGPLSWLDRAHAAVLASGDGAVLGFAAAAHVVGLLDRPPAATIVLVPHERQVRSLTPDVWVRRRRHLRATAAYDVPVTDPAETVLDLASVTTATRAVAHAARAVQLGLTSTEALAVALRARPRHRHRATLRLALMDIEAGAESLLELRFVRDVERRHGLPSSRMQVPGRGRSGTVRRDFEYAAELVVVEVDGRLGHAGEGTGTDRRRDRESAASGRLTLRAGWVDVTGSPCVLALDLARTLRSRGWRGTPTPCGPGCALQRWP